MRSPDRLRLAGQRQIALEHLIGVAADFYAGAVAVEGLRPLWRTRAPPPPLVLIIVVIRIAAAIAAARSLLWSHDTCLVAVDPVGPSSARRPGTSPLVLDPSSYAALSNPSIVTTVFGFDSATPRRALRGSNLFLAGVPSARPARHDAARMPARSGTMASIAKPARRDQRRDRRSWPWPISPAKMPPVATGAAASAAIAR
jgi:hypothetical protein